MKSFVQLILSIILVAFFSIYSIRLFQPQLWNEALQLIKQPCSEPLTYKIGFIDERYQISQNQFQKELEQAERIWEESLGRDLFSYNPGGDITVNFIYDERQQLESKASSLESGLTQKKQELLPAEQSYKEKVDDFKKRSEELNSRIEYWNNQGGAPPEEYEKLLKQQSDLKAELEEINSLVAKLNKSVFEYNSQVGILNQTVENLNQVLQFKPEEGIFDPNLDKIDIFLIVNKNELIHTLAHEFGHALGVEHNNNRKSIMFPYTTSLLETSSEDIEALQNICNSKLIERIKGRIRFRFGYL